MFLVLFPAGDGLGHNGGDGPDHGGGGAGTAVFLVYGLVDLPRVRLFPGHAGGDCPGHGGEAGGGDQASSLH